MRFSARSLITSVTLMAIAGVSPAAAADDLQTCVKGSGDVAMAACSRAIASRRLSGNNLVAAYNFRGLNYKRIHDYDGAFANYDQAIRLNPQLAPVYNNRGVAYTETGDYDRAIADADQAIRLAPKVAIGYSNRAAAYRGKGDYARALMDEDQAIQLDPRGETRYFSRGITNYYLGLLPKAQADLNEASELNSKDALVALWLDIANRRGNVPSRLAEMTKQIDMTKWPAPVIRLFLGQMTLEAVLAAADDPNPRTKKERLCEANFFAGELELQQGPRDKAIDLFRSAAADCPRYFINAYTSARAELKALGATP